MAIRFVVLCLAALAGCAPEPVLGPPVDLPGVMPGQAPPQLPGLQPAGPQLGPEAPYVALVDPPEVQRVWIPAGVNKHGDMVSGYWVYLIVRQSRFFLEREDDP